MDFYGGSNDSMSQPIHFSIWLLLGDLSVLAVQCFACAWTGFL